MKCSRCRRVLPAREATGRKRRYCSDACRVAAWRKRHRKLRSTLEIMGSSRFAAWRAALPERLRYPATSALRQALAAAVAWELIDENPAKKAGKNPQPKAREIRPLTVEELGRIVGEIRRSRPARHLRR